MFKDSIWSLYMFLLRLGWSLDLFLYINSGEKREDTEFLYYMNEGVYGPFSHKLLGNTIAAPSLHKVSSDVYAFKFILKKKQSLYSCPFFNSPFLHFYPSRFCLKIGFSSHFFKLNLPQYIKYISTWRHNENKENDSLTEMFGILLTN